MKKVKHAVANRFLLKSPEDISRKCGKIKREQLKSS
jgi:hypothetical protein